MTDELADERESFVGVAVSGAAVSADGGALIDPERETILPQAGIAAGNMRARSRRRWRGDDCVTEPMEESPNGDTHCTECELWIKGRGVVCLGNVSVASGSTIA